METGNGVTSSSPLWRRSLDGVGASRMLLESRMPEEAKAWSKTQERLTSGRYAARESHESEAMCQNTGFVPEGGLARHRVEERAAPCLPPPKADVPSRATGRYQNRTQASEVAREVMVCSTVSGASYYPGQPGETHRGDRRGQDPHTAPTMATGQHATPRWHRHRAQPHLDTQTWFKDGKAPTGHSDGLCILHLLTKQFGNCSR